MNGSERKERAMAVMDRVRTDPAWFFTNILGCDPWQKQIELADAVRDHKDVAFKSCHAIGKDWAAARVAVWFLYAHWPSLVVTTAPTDRQCKEILWREIEQACSRSKVKLGGKPLTQSIRISESQLAIGFTASATDPDKFQGFHCENILVILDEASGISPSTYVAVDACLTSANAHRLEIGNPTVSVSEFANSFKRPGVHKISVSAFDTPNFTAFGITQDDLEHGFWQQKVRGPLPRPELITPEWAAKMLAKWGPNNPLYRSRILAEFPTNSADVLITIDQVEKAQQRVLPAGSPRVMAVDVARYGSDYTVIMTREGGLVRTVERINGQDTMGTVGKIIRAMREFKPDHLIVDGAGVGGGVVDRLREQHVDVNDFVGGANAQDVTQSCNARSEGYWNLRCALERGDIALDANDENLIGQLCDIKWSVDSKGRVQIEAKDQIKHRLGCSPDDADALSMLYSDSWMGEPVYYDAVKEYPARSMRNPYGTDYERARVG